MAAHILTAMSETLQDVNPQKCEAMLFALDYARFGDQLDLDEWRILKALLKYSATTNDYDALKSFWWYYPSKRLWAEWEKFGCPDTIEQWLERKYNPVIA